MKCLLARWNTTSGRADSRHSMGLARSNTACSKTYGHIPQGEPLSSVTYAIFFNFYRVRLWRTVHFGYY